MSPPLKHPDASHRIRPAAETLGLVRPLLAEMGITRVANVTGLDRIGIPTVLVTRPNARSLSVSQGKGYDLDAARISGVMEAIELYHAETVHVALRLSSYDELARHAPVVDATRLPRFVRRFDPAVPILWTLARDLQGESVYVPYDLVHANLARPRIPVSGFFPFSSNGLASGNSLAEAVTHGALEVIERDAIALFYRRSPSEQFERRLDLDSVDDARCRDLLQRFDAAEIDVAVWDMTSDVGLPAFYCSIIERELNVFHRVGKASGWGCHLERGEALKRALTEAAQSRLTRIAGSRDDLQQDALESLRSEASILEHQVQLKSPVRPPHRFSRVPTYRFETLEDDLAFIRERLEDCGMEQLVYVELTLPDLPVRVVRVIVPGLEGIVGEHYVPGERALARSVGAG